MPGTQWTAADLHRMNARAPPLTSPMKPHTDYPALRELATHVHQQRRLLAGQLRITREERALREKVDTLLEHAHVDAVTCAIPLGNYEVRRQIASDGHRYASITPISRTKKPLKNRLRPPRRSR